MKFSYKQNVLKMAKYLVIFALPILVDKFIVNYPDYAQLTVATVLVGITNYLKVKVGLRLP